MEDVTPPLNELNQFTPSGDLGSWSQVKNDPATIFTSLSRTRSGAYSSGSGLGFALGGIETSQTTSSIDGSGEVVFVPGLIVSISLGTVKYPCRC